MYEFNQFKSIFDKQAEQHFSFPSVEEWLAHFKAIKVQRIRKKEDAGVYVFGQFKDAQGGRTKDNMKSNQFIVLDIDHTSLAELETALSNIDKYHYVFHETFSSTEEHLKIRIIFPLRESISSAAYFKDKVASRLAAMIGIAEIDQVSNKPAQAYFLPSSPIGKEKGEYDVHRGKNCLSIGDLPAQASSVKAKQTSKFSGVDKNEDGEDELVAEAKRIAKEEFDDNIYFINNRFHIYDDGIWQHYSKAELQKCFVLEVYESKKNLAFVNGVLSALQVVIHNNAFPDSKNDVVVFESCAINPFSGKKIKHNPRHFARNKLNFDYDNQATCPLWLDFLGQCWGQDSDFTEKVALLQEYMGLSLTCLTKFQKMLWLIGEGSNGKSVIFKVVRALVGPYNCSALPFENFNKRFAVEQLEHKLVNLDPEMSSTAVLADATVKSVVGGEEISMERKNEPVFKSMVTAKLWAAANSLPTTKDHSYGFFRRVMILEFNRVITEAEQDKSLDMKLMTELPGIFNWALTGLHRLVKNDGFTIPSSSTKQVDDYQINSNPVALFFRDHLVKKETEGRPSAGMRAELLFEQYKIFAGANCFKAISKPTFGTRMSALGAKGERSNGITYYPVTVKGMEVYKKDVFSEHGLKKLKSMNAADYFAEDSEVMM